MQTKYDIGQTVYLPAEVIRIDIDKQGDIRYAVTINVVGRNIENIKQEELNDDDVIPVADYEREVNKLKDEINSLRGYYRVNVNEKHSDRQGRSGENDDKRFDAGAEETAGTGTEENGGTV